MKQNPALAFGVWVSMLCLLLLALTPAASAARMSGARQTARRMRWMPRVENGIVTDSDGIIGNSATGADHARHVRRPRPAHMMTGADIPADPMLPELPENGMNGGMGDLPNGTDMMPGTDDGTSNDMLPDASQGNPTADQNGNLANDTGNGADNAMDDTTAGGILPWVIGIIVLLAVVLIVLSLMPKRKRNS